MTRKLKLFVVSALAALAISVGGLVAAPSASAQPMSCEVAHHVADNYTWLGDYYFAHGMYSAAAAYYGRANGVLEAAC